MLKMENMINSVSGTWILRNMDSGVKCYTTIFIFITSSMSHMPTIKYRNIIVKKFRNNFERFRANLKRTKRDWEFSKIWNGCKFMTYYCTTSEWNWTNWDNFSAIARFCNVFRFALFFEQITLIVFKSSIKSLIKANKVDSVTVPIIAMYLRVDNALYRNTYSMAMANAYPIGQFVSNGNLGIIHVQALNNWR